MSLVMEYLSDCGGPTGACSSLRSEVHRYKLPLQQPLPPNLPFPANFDLMHSFAERVYPRLPGWAGWRRVLRYMAVSLSDAAVRNRLMPVVMRVRMIFIIPPQHLQRIAGRVSVCLVWLF